MNQAVIISADSHIVEPPHLYRDFIDPAFRERAPRVEYVDPVGDVYLIEGQRPVPLGIAAAAGKHVSEIRLDAAIRFEDLPLGGHDPDARLADQARDGVHAEILYPTVGMVLCNHPDLDFRKACFDAYNRWMSEYCATHPKRLIGNGQSAMRTPEEGILDLESIRALGLRGVMLPGQPGVADYDSPVYDDFFRAAIDLDLPLSFHILTMRDAKLRGPRLNGFLQIMRGCQDIMGLLVLGGVFERHPKLHVVCVEADAGWVPHYMYRMDHAFDRHRNWLHTGQPLSRKPSEYFADNIWVTFQDDWVAFRTADMMNWRHLMWANDFPHSDSTWPDSQALLAEHTKVLSAEQCEAILSGNVAELYGIDRAELLAAS